MLRLNLLVFIIAIFFFDGVMTLRLGNQRSFQQLENIVGISGGKRVARKQIAAESKRKYSLHNDDNDNEDVADDEDEIGLDDDDDEDEDDDYVDQGEVDDDEEEDDDEEFSRDGEEEEEEDGDDEEEFEPAFRGKRESSSPKELFSSKRDQIRAQNGRRTRSKPRKSPFSSRLAAVFQPASQVVLSAIKNVDLQAKMGDLSKQGQNIYQNVFRRAKMLGSSSFESMILKATWPSDDPIPPEIIDEMINVVIPSFAKSEKRKGSGVEVDDPYRMTLHKIWAKACEIDWRTILKALHLQHILYRESKGVASQRFCSSLISMSKYRNPKSKETESRYFDVGIIGRVTDATNAVHVPFLRQYGQYIMFAMKNLGGKFKTLRGVTVDSSTEEEAVKTLLTAKKAMETILKCKYAPIDKNHIIVGQAVKSLAVDLSELWGLFTDKMAPLLRRYGKAQPAGASAPQSGEYRSGATSSATASNIESLFDFYNKGGKMVNDFISLQSKSFRLKGLRFPGQVAAKAAVVCNVSLLPVCSGSSLDSGSDNSTTTTTIRKSSDKGSSSVASSSSATGSKGKKQSSNLPPNISKVSGGFIANHKRPHVLCQNKIRRCLGRFSAYRNRQENQNVM